MHHENWKIKMYQGVNSDRNRRRLVYSLIEVMTVNALFLNQLITSWLRGGTYTDHGQFVEFGLLNLEDSDPFTTNKCSLIEKFSF